MFTNLSVLDLSRNGIRSILHIPPSLKALTLNSNPLLSSAFEGCLSPTRTLKYLSLAYCGFKEFPSCSHSFPGIVALDISGNDVIDADSFVSCVKDLAFLRILSVSGNPFTLAPNSRRLLLYNLPSITDLDDLPAEEVDDADFSTATACLKITVTSLNGLPEADGPAQAIIKISLGEDAAQSSLLPWASNLVADVGEIDNVAATTATVVKGKVEKTKKGEVAPKPTSSASPPVKINLEFQPTSRIRDAIFLNGWPLFQAHPVL